MRMRSEYRLTLLALLTMASALAFTAAPAHAQEPAPPAQQYAPPPPSEPQQAQPYYAPQQPQPYYAQPQPYAQPGYGPVYAQPAPAPREQTVSRPNYGLIISGAVLLGVGWVLNIITGLPAGDDPFSSGSTAEWDAFRVTSIIPAAGPWIQLAVKPTPFSQDYWGPWLIIDGLMQAAGLIMLVVGIATPRTETVLAQGSGGGVELAFVPRIGPDQLGAGLLGRF